MIRHYESIENLGIDLCEFLSALASVSQNVNDEVLKTILEDYMKDYAANRDLINNRLKQEKRLVKMQNTQLYKNKLLNSRYEVKQSRYLRFRRWLLNIKLYREFKRKTKLMAKQEYNTAKAEVDKLKVELKTSLDFAKKQKEDIKADGKSA